MNALKCNEANENGLRVSILLKKMVWYLDVIEKLQNYEYLIYIYTDKVKNGGPIIFDKTLYHYWYKELSNHFSPVMIDNTYKNVHY